MDTAKLLASIDRNGPEVIPGSPCWRYKGKTDSRGRAQIWLDGKNMNARRAVYESVNGPLADVELRMVCGTVGCLRPEHCVLTTFTRGFLNRGNAAKKKVTDD